MELKRRIIDLKCYLTSLFIIILPFLYTEETLDPVLSLRFFLFSILVLILTLLNFKKKIDISLLRHSIVLCFLSLISIFCISTLFLNNVISEAIYVTIKLALFLFYLINITDILKDDLCRNRLFISISLFSIICSVLYLFQVTNLYFYHSDRSKWFFITDLTKLAATMANKNLLSSALFLTIPFSFYNLYSCKKIVRIISILSLMLIPIVFFFTNSKATLLGLFILILSILVLKLLPKTFVKVFYYSVIFTFLISCFSIVYINDYKSSFSLKLKDHLIEYSNNEELFNDKRSSFGTRINLYKNTLDLIKKNPILGVGPGNWKIQHGKYSLYRTLGEDGRKLVQRPHNDFLWIASESGIISGIIYLLIFIIALKNIHFKIYKKDDKKVLFNYSVFGVLLGYFSISLFDFPLERITHNILFVILLSYIISLSKKSQLNVSNRFHKIFWFISVFFICISSYVAKARHTGEIHLTKAKFYKGKNSSKLIIRNVDNAFIPNIYEVDRSGTPIHWYKGVANFSLNNLDESFNDFKIAYQHNPFHLHVLNNIGTLYELKGNSTKAKMYYNSALDISPRFEEVSVNLSAILFNEGKIQEALDIILRCNIEKDLLKYDKYLKTISLSMIENYLNNTKLKISDRNKILYLKGLFLNDIIQAKFKIRHIYELRKSSNSHYLDLYLKTNI